VLIALFSIAFFVAVQLIARLAMPYRHATTSAT
jgi:hypothetical protein